MTEYSPFLLDLMADARKVPAPPKAQRHPLRNEVLVDVLWFWAVVGWAVAFIALMAVLT